MVSRQGDPRLPCGGEIRGGKSLPDRTFEEAGALAAYYSKGRENDKVEVDYIQRKHVKKAAGGAPGFVIYHTNYSLIARPILHPQRGVGANPAARRTRAVPCRRSKKALTQGLFIFLKQLVVDLLQGSVVGDAVDR